MDNRYFRYLPGGIFRIIIKPTKKENELILQLILDNKYVYKKIIYEANISSKGLTFIEFDKYYKYKKN